MSNEELLYWLEQDSVSNMEAFLPADTPLGTLSASLVKSRLESLRRKHQRTIERLINQQTFALADFQAAFAERTDLSLFPQHKKGVFEFVHGDRFLLEKQEEIMNLLTDLQKPSEGNQVPKSTQDTSSAPDPFPKNVKLVYEGELEELRNRQKRLFEEFQTDYIEQKAVLEKQLAQVAAPKEPETKSPPTKRLRFSPQMPHHEPPSAAHRVGNTATPPPSASHRTALAPSPAAAHRGGSAPAPSLTTSRRVTNSPPPRKAPQHQQPSAIQAMASRALSRDPRIQHTNRSPNGRPPEVASSGSSRPPEVGASLLKRPKHSKVFKKMAQPPEVASSSPKTGSPKPPAKYTTGSLIDKGTIDLFDGELVLIERGAKVKSILGSAKQFDEALHSPHADCPLYIRVVNSERYFCRKEDHARIAPVSKLEPMIRNHLLRS